VRIEETFTVAAPLPTVADFLLDVERVAACVPGVGEVREIGQDEYEAVLSVRVGPISSSFAGSVQLDRGDAPSALKATAKGRDRASGSLVDVRFTARLHENGEAATEVRTEADVVVRGRLGQFGTGVIKGTSQELVKQFSDCVNASITAPERAATTEPAPEPAAARPLRLLPVVLRGLLSSLRDLLARLRRR
jgi:uncharacterized protein